MGSNSSQKLLVPHLVNKFPTFWVAQMFNTALTSTRHLFLSSATLIQSMSPHLPSLISISKLHSHLCLGLPSSLFLSGFPTAKLCINPILLFRVYTKMNTEEIHMHVPLLTYLLTPCSRILLEKITSSQLVKKFSTF